MKTKYNVVYLFLLLLFAGCDENDDFTSDVKPEDIETNMVKIEGNGSTYYIGKYEVTQAEWQAVMGYNPSRIKGADRPVESVTSAEVKQFIDKLRELTGEYYALPTSSQWVYAAKGGTEENDVDATAWYTGNSGGKPHPVGAKEPNAFGLYDMVGNVMELVQSYDKKDHYYGGCWSSEKDRCTPASDVQLSLNEYRRIPNVGFRLVKNVKSISGEWKRTGDYDSRLLFETNQYDGELLEQMKNKDIVVEIWKDGILYKTISDVQITVAPIKYGYTVWVDVDFGLNKLEYGIYQLRLVSGKYYSSFQDYNYFKIWINGYHSDVKANSVAIDGGMEILGKPEIKEWGVCYSKETEYPWPGGKNVASDKYDITTNSGHYSLSDLSSGTTYYYRIYVKAKSALGKDDTLYNSEIKHFTTE